MATTAAPAPAAGSTEEPVSARLPPLVVPLFVVPPVTVEDDPPPEPSVDVPVEPFEPPVGPSVPLVEPPTEWSSAGAPVHLLPGDAL
ncbi:hypothetical protein [Streptomyces sp. DSM 118148]|uniref:hypothetical protein n=1 Tax=Streptomyces sp. DSM 118148 TaxID=3448667 RepID=UPI00403FDC06